MTDRRQNAADFRLSLGGEDLRGSAADPIDLTAKVRPRLISLSLIEKRGGEADQLDIVLDDSDGKLALPSKGAIIALSLGWARGSDVTVGLVDKGRFKVDDVEWGGPPDQVTIRARAADITAKFRKRREKGWRDTTLGAIAREVAGRNGLTARVAPELASVEVKVLAQHHQSDMALLRRLGHEHDAVATVKDGKLILSPIGKGRTSSGRALPALALSRTEVSDYRYREVERAGDAGVEARWHDQDSGERKTVVVKAPAAPDEDADLWTGEGDGDDPGVGTGEGDGDDPGVGTGEGDGDDPGVGMGEGETPPEPRRLRRVYHSEADARAAAKAEAGRAKRAGAEFECALPLGRPDVFPERPVKIAGFKDRADRRFWVVAEVAHTLDGNGLTTRLKLETKT